MTETLKSIAGFLGILLISLAGIGVSEYLKLGNMSAVIVTVDNVTHVR